MGGSKTLGWRMQEAFLHSAAGWSLCELNHQNINNYSLSAEN